MNIDRRTQKRILDNIRLVANIFHFSRNRGWNSVKLKGLRINPEMYNILSISFRVLLGFMSISEVVTPPNFPTELCNLFSFSIPFFFRDFKTLYSVVSVLCYDCWFSAKKLFHWSWINLFYFITVLSKFILFAIKIKINLKYEYRFIPNNRDVKKKYSAQNVSIGTYFIFEFGCLIYYGLMHNRESLLANYCWFLYGVLLFIV